MFAIIAVLLLSLGLRALGGALAGSRRRNSLGKELYTRRLRAGPDC